MLKHTRFFQKCLLLLSVLSIASCTPDFDPPPSTAIVQPGMSGEISYNINGTDVMCTGLPSALATLTTTNPGFWIVGLDLDLNANIQDPTSVYTYRIDLLIQNVNDINDLVGATIPLEDDVINASTDMHFIASGVNQLDPIKQFMFTDLTFNISSVSNNLINGTFSGTIEHYSTGDTRTITNGKIIDVLYTVEP